MPTIRVGGGLSGGVSHDAEEHSDWVGEMIKLPQANGGVKTKVTSHMTGNNSEGIEGGIDNKGTKQTDKQEGFRKSHFADGHGGSGGIHRQY